MKYYQFKQKREESINKLFDKYGVFFAFSKKQLEKNKKDGEKYYSLGSGMFVPQKNIEKFEKEYSSIGENFVKNAKEKFTACEIIKYELANHEYYITYDLSDTKDVLEEFNFSDEDYNKARKEYLAECEE